MFSSRAYYILSTVDLVLAFACAVMGDPRAFVFFFLAAVTRWVAGKVKDLEEKGKGDQNG